MFALALASCGLTGAGRVGVPADASGGGGLAAGAAAPRQSSAGANTPSREARALNLSRAELPDYRASAVRLAWRAIEPANLSRCPGVAGAPSVADVASARFLRRGGLAGQAVSSDVAVFASAAAARREALALAGQPAAHCVQDPVRRALEPVADTDGIRFRTSVQTTVFAVPGLPRGATSFGYRTALGAVPSAAGEPAFTVYDDLIGFTAGRALIEIDTVSARELFPRREERRLVRVLLRHSAVSPVTGRGT